MGSEQGERVPYRVSVTYVWENQDGKECVKHQLDYIVTAVDKNDAESRAEADGYCVTLPEGQPTVRLRVARNISPQEYDRLFELHMQIETHKQRFQSQGHGLDRDRESEGT